VRSVRRPPRPGRLRWSDAHLPFHDASHRFQVTGSNSRVTGQCFSKRIRQRSRGARRQAPDNTRIATRKELPGLRAQRTDTDNSQSLAIRHDGAVSDRVEHSLPSLLQKFEVQLSNLVFPQNPALLCIASGRIPRRVCGFCNGPRFRKADLCRCAQASPVAPLAPGDSQRLQFRRISYIPPRFDPAVARPPRRLSDRAKYARDRFHPLVPVVPALRQLSRPREPLKPLCPRCLFSGSALLRQFRGSAAAPFRPFQRAAHPPPPALDVHLSTVA